MYVVDYDLRGKQRSKGVWHIPVDTIQEVCVIVEERCRRLLEVIEVAWTYEGDGLYGVHVDDTRVGSFRARQL